MANSDESYDAIIVGAGIAGLTAAVFLARAGLKTLVVGDVKKSMLADAENVGNYIGLNHLKGIDILERGVKQAKEYGAEVLTGEVVNASQDEKSKIITIKTADEEKFTGKTIIIATGTQYKESGADNEGDFKGKGIHYCVSCDGFFYKGKRVIVLGSGNLAAEEAVEMTAFTKDVTLISQGEKFEMTEQMMAALKKSGIKMMEGRVQSFTGKEHIEGAKLEDGTVVAANGVFVAMGTATGIDFSNKLGIIMDEGVIQVDKNGKTNLDGVYAAGSCIGGNVQIAKSAGDGCNAAIAIVKLLKGVESYVDQT